MKEISVSGNTLSVSHAKITFKYPIKKIERINGKYIVLLKIPSGARLGFEECNNVFCYDANGEKCWRIGSKLPIGIISRAHMPYVAIDILDGELYANDFWGRRFRVNAENGKLIDFKAVR